MKTPKALWVIVAMVVVESTLVTGSYLYQNLFEGTRVRSLVFSSDSQTVYGSGTESHPKQRHGWTWAWSTKTGRLLWKSQAAEPMQLTRLSPEGDLLLTTPFQGEPKLWDTTTGRLRHSLKRDPVRGKISESYFTPDGKCILGCFREGIQVWDTQTGEPIAFWSLPEGEHTNYSWPNSLQFSADGTKMLVQVVNGTGTEEDTIEEDGCLQLWDSRTGRVWKECVGSSHIAAVSPAGDKIAVVITRYDDNRNCFRDAVEISGIQKGSPRIRSSEFKPDFELKSLEFLPDGNLLCKGRYIGAEASIGQQAFLWNVPKKSLKEQPVPNTKDTGGTISPDNRLKALTRSGGYRNRPPLGTLYDARTGKKLHDLEGLAGR